MFPIFQDSFFLSKVLTIFDMGLKGCCFSNLGVRCLRQCVNSQQSMINKKITFFRYVFMFSTFISFLREVFHLQ